ncbi:receptor-like protein kinase ANXUR1 [Prunus avium]|uniref:non-specific serine/threonine protein kinase n=1 Tax=Prunus avium TaxID=42229 RepID=A0A6P5S1Y5_PRUAV|nr:receptor-like protein kinase ANXUR1 [Prunus avium]
MRIKTHIVFFISFVSVFLNGLHAANSDSDSLILGCGSENEAKDADGRKWQPDSKYLTGSKGSPAQAQYQDPALLSEVPYMKARIFTSNATYKFPVKPKQRYIIRLYFYPAVYGSNNAEQSYFAVIANGITVLQNFSASITCKALTQAYIMREYFLAPLNKDSLEVTFSPSAGFAFVNGIELIGTPDMFGSATIVGASDQTFDGKSTNLQTMFRVNIGGQFISPTNDSGALSRTWYDDFAYVFGAQLGVTNEAAKDVKIDYKDMPGYIAPVDIYKTSRSMGEKKDINLSYNLTWVFNQVDPKFMYLVRLHFCDFYLSKTNQIVFTVYINNQTAEAEADVIGWTGGKGVPTYRDYVVALKDGSDGNLWLALHPATKSRPEFYDALINGVEIFKLEQGKTLAGPNPNPSEMLAKDQERERSFENQQQQGGSGTNKAHVIGGAAGGAAAFGIVAALCIAVYQRKKKALGTETHTSSWLPLYGNSHTSGTKSTISGKSTASSHLTTAAQGRCRRFSFIEMKQATKSFDESNVIGVGGFGKVYKGVIDAGTKVAIKRSNPQSEQGVHEFQTEIEMLSELRHKHLVSLIGFCDEDNEMCLVYDFMSRGTLREHLYKGNKSQAQLSWKKRLEICIGAAKGLHYLHTGARWTIIHRDVKTTNILLDENWEAKVSDFGLSKTGPNMDNGHVSTVVKGSFGYLDPEYFRRQQLTEKSDVYSFGVVLFEALCARPALNPSLPKEQVSLADWALHCQRKGTLEDIIDPHLKGKVNMESIKKFADTAEKCLSDAGTDRPTLNDILWNLEFALQLQDDPDGSNHSSRRARSDSDDAHLRNQNMMAIHYSNLSLGSESDLNEESNNNNNTNSNETTGDSSAIFSQIVNPKGR